MDRNLSVSTLPISLLRRPIKLKLKYVVLIGKIGHSTVRILHLKSRSPEITKNDDASGARPVTRPVLGAAPTGRGRASRSGVTVQVGSCQRQVGVSAGLIRLEFRFRLIGSGQGYWAKPSIGSGYCNWV